MSVRFAQDTVSVCGSFTTGSNMALSRRRNESRMRHMPLQSTTLSIDACENGSPTQVISIQHPQRNLYEVHYAKGVTALRPRHTLGLTEITHPFHPLRGQRFIVLKVRKVSGVEILSLRHTEMGSLAIRRDWTDWGPPGTSVEPIIGQRSLLVDTLGLLALAELVGSLKRKK